MAQTLIRTITATHILPRAFCLSAGLGLAVLFSAAGPAPADAQRAPSAANSGEFRVAAHIKKRRRYVRRSYVRRSRKIDKPIATPAWFPKTELKDPIQIIVSLPEQKLTVYRGDKVLVTSRLSSGKSGFSTPAGVFSILQKNRYHYSNIYRGAPMPYMQRLTWSGIAFHGSNSVPVNSPASHGCIRLPHAFASQLFKFTEKGAHVVVANEKVEPFEIAHDNLFQPSPRPAKDLEPAAEQWGVWGSGIKIEQPKKSTSPLRILVTRRTGGELFKDMQSLLNELSFGAGDVDGYMGPDTAQAIRRFQATYGLWANGMVSDELIAKLYEIAGRDAPLNGHLYVRQDFNPLFDVPVKISGGETPLGSHMFTAMHFEPDATQTRWLAVTLKKGSGDNAAYGSKVSKKKNKPVEEVVLTAAAPLASTAEEALGRIEIPNDIRTRIAGMLTPGSSLAITNNGISRETTPKGSDFVVLMQ